MTSQKSNSILLKITTSLLVGEAIINAATSLLGWYGNGMQIPFINTTNQELIAGLVIGIILFTVWYVRERKQNSLLIYPALLQGTVRWWLAYIICDYGFAKIFETQLFSPPHRYDVTLGDSSGITLTWFYFGYSRTMVLILAGIQIFGGIFLMYRKTVLIGVLMLLPMMLNIILINVFYDIAYGALINSLLISAALIYLILLDFDRIKSALLNYHEALTAHFVKSGWVATLLCVSAVGLAAGGIKVRIAKNPVDKTLYGVYNVEELTRNGKVLAKDAWLTDSTAFARIYFSGLYGCAFSPNPYRYKPAESLRGSYTFNESREELKVKYTNPKSLTDTVTYSVKDRTHDHVTIAGILGSDTLQLKLKRFK